MALSRSTVTRGAPPPEAANAGSRTRRRLVGLAVRRFGEVGYRDTSIAAVARDAGVTPAAVYPYFRTERDLFLAAAEDDIGALLDEARQATSTSPLPWLSLLQHVVDHVDEHPLVVRLLDGEPTELLTDVLDLAPLRTLGIELRDQLVAAQSRGQVRADVDCATMALGVETVALALLGGVVRRTVGELADRRLAVGSVLAAALLPPTTPPGGGRPRAARPRRAGTTPIGPSGPA